MNKIIAVVLSVAVVIAIGGAYLFPRVQTIVGANPGPNMMSNLEFFGETLHRATSATSSAASATLLPANLPCGGSLLVSLPVGSVSLTLPASSTMASKFSGTGSRCSVAIVNASTTASQNVTLVAGTGWKVATTTAAQLVVYPGTSAVLDFVKKANGDITGTIYNQALAQ